MGGIENLRLFADCKIVKTNIKLTNKQVSLDL